jgi:hypothetical protein
MFAFMGLAHAMTSQSGERHLAECIAGGPSFHAALPSKSSSLSPPPPPTITPFELNRSAMSQSLINAAGKRLFAQHMEEYRATDPLYEEYVDTRGKTKRRKVSIPNVW